MFRIRGTNDGLTLRDIRHYHSVFLLLRKDSDASLNVDMTFNDKRMRVIARYRKEA